MPFIYNTITSTEIGSLHLSNMQLLEQNQGLKTEVC